jgi:hypothetical protein
LWWVCLRVNTDYRHWVSDLRSPPVSGSGFIFFPQFLVRVGLAGLKARSWGASTPMKMCIQAVLDGTGALRHMNKNNSERPVCTTHSLTPVFDTEWVMSTCEHQGRDIVL